MTRLEANLQILKKLEDFLKANPDQRFGQALYNLDIADVSYNEEPVETLSRIDIQED